MSRTRVVWSRAPEQPPLELARFTLAGDQVLAEYSDEGRWIGELGLLVAEGTLYPNDGRRFFDALELAFSRSSLMTVTES